MDDLKIELTAQRIRKLREERGMSLRKFAKLIGCKPTALFKWETGDVGSMKSSSIKKISDACFVSPLWVMGYDVPKEKESEEHRGLRNEISDSLLSMTLDDLKQVEKFIHAFIIKKGD